MHTHYGYVHSKYITQYIFIYKNISEINTERQLAKAFSK